MTQEQQASSEILFELVTSLEPRLKTLAVWYTELMSSIDLWIRSEGNQGIKRAKDALSQAWLAILGEETTQLDFVSSTNGIPDIVVPFVDRVNSLRKDPRLLSAALSIVRVTDLWEGRLEDSTVLRSLDVIQNSRLPSTAKPIIEEFSTFVNSFVNQYPDHPLAKAWHRAIHLDDRYVTLYRESKGPNGELTVNAHKDVKSLMEARCDDGLSLLEHVVKLENDVSRFADFSFHASTTFVDRLIQWEGFKDLKVSETPGKLSIVTEKSGKVRLVASPDYFSQLAMHPLSDWLFNVLKAIPMDCTFDQRSAIPKIGAWQEAGKTIYSFDQSSCTDLFPFELQLKLLSSRFDETLTESVRTVMSDRDWSIKLPSGRTKKIRWSVGQPMGIMGSWPLMALAHHFLVQYCYWRSSGKQFPKKGPFSDYVICGDDIVIASKSVADDYRKVVTLLGMKINLAKSHISGGSTNVPPVSEFAKIIVWKGKPLYPIRPKMVLTAVHDWRYAVPLLIDISNVDGFNARLKTIERIILKHFPNGRKFLIPLLTIPRELGGVGFRDCASFRSKFTLVDARQIHPMLYYLALKVRHGLLTEKKVMSERDDLFDQIPLDVYREHPYKAHLDRTLRESRWAYGIDSALDESVPLIAYMIVEHGFGTNDRFLFGPSTAVPPQIRERQLLNERTLWEKALDKRHYFPRRLARPHWHDDFELLVETALGRPLTDDEYLVNLEDRQCDICSKVILARRFQTSAG